MEESKGEGASVIERARPNTRKQKSVRGNSKAVGAPYLHHNDTCASGQALKTMRFHHIRVLQPGFTHTHMYTHTHTHTDTHTQAVKMKAEAGLPWEDMRSPETKQCMAPVDAAGHIALRMTMKLTPTRQSSALFGRALLAPFAAQSKDKGEHSLL